MNDDDFKVTVADAHACNLCSRGIAKKLESLGYDRRRIMDILRNGMPLGEARRLNDGQMNAVIEKALIRKQRENG